MLGGLAQPEASRQADPDDRRGRAHRAGARHDHHVVTRASHAPTPSRLMYCTAPTLVRRRFRSRNAGRMRRWLLHDHAARSVSLGGALHQGARGRRRVAAAGSTNRELRERARPGLHTVGRAGPIDLAFAGAPHARAEAIWSRGAPPARRRGGLRRSADHHLLRMRSACLALRRHHPEDGERPTACLAGAERSRAPRAHDHRDNPHRSHHPLTLPPRPLPAQPAAFRSTLLPSPYLDARAVRDRRTTPVVALISLDGKRRARRASSACAAGPTPAGDTK